MMNNNPKKTKMMMRLIYIAIIALLIPAETFCQQLPKSALNYMHQKPKVMKHFDDSTTLSRSFWEFGAGLTSVLGSDNGDYIYFKSPSAMGSIRFGYWLTPEHGMRLGLELGDYNNNGIHNKFGGVSADYLLNITALSQYSYNRRHAFEIYGIAGGEFVYSHISGSFEHALGAHLGLQGSMRVGDCLNLFIEPRIGLYQDNLLHINTWRGYRPAASVLAGFGYNMNRGRLRSTKPSPYHDFLDGLFVSTAAGGSMFIHSAQEGNKSIKGIKSALSIGKWFNPYSAFRISGTVFRYNQVQDKAMKGASAHIDYLFNMSNIFGGYIPDRLFEMNGVVGYDINYTNYYENKDQYSFSQGIGTGLQANFFLNRKHTFAFFLEPRIDVNNYTFFLEPRVNISHYDHVSSNISYRNMDITTSIMAGFTLYRAPSDISIHQQNETYPNTGLYDHIFIETGAGIQSLMLAPAVNNPDNYLGSIGYIGLGKWLTPTSGIKLSFMTGNYRQGNHSSLKYGSVGIDYLWNISNALIGYLPERKVEFIGSLGANIARRSYDRDIYFGGDAGVQALWHISRQFGLFVQPQLRIYNNNFAEGKMRLFGNDGIGSIMAGIHIDMGGYSSADYNEAFSQFDNKAFFSYAGGMTFKPFKMNIRNLYGATGRLSMGRWTSPLTAWRLSISESTYKRYTKRYASGTLGGDYLFDISTLGAGFNPERIVSFRLLGGMDLSLDYHHQTTTFTPSLHAGGQMAVRLSHNTEVFLEPQLGFDLMHVESQGSRKIDGKLMLGFTHSIKDHSASSSPTSKEGYKNFFTIGTGMGMNSETVLTNHPFYRKWTFNTNITYGRWIDNKSGFRIGFSDEFVQRVGRTNKQDLTLHADYMLNFSTLLNKGQAEDNTLNVIGNIGISGNSGVSNGSKPCLAPGIYGSLQADIRLTDGVSLFIEPSVNIMGKNIQYPTTHPYEVSGKLDIGTKINF
jgi:hypothetical protein